MNEEQIVDGRKLYTCIRSSFFEYEVTKLLYKWKLRATNGLATSAEISVSPGNSHCSSNELLLPVISVLERDSESYYLNLLTQIADGNCDSVDVAQQCTELHRWQS